MTRILLADDHHVIRLGLRHLLSKQEDWEICGEAVNGREAVEMAQEMQPHVVILDLNMPEVNGLDAARQIRIKAPDAAILIYTMDETEEIVHDGLIAGARGIVLKSDVHSHIVAAVEALASGKPYFTAGVAETLLKSYLSNSRKTTVNSSVPDSALSAREREVIQLLAEGKSNKEVASDLGISTRTAEAHRAEIMRKIQVNSLAGLIRYAIRNGIVEA
jgi:DNA-binding NarL/FixJ family response regulator